MAGFFVYFRRNLLPMLKRIIFFILLLTVLGAAFTGWRFFLSNTPFSEKTRYLYIHTGMANRSAVLKSLKDSNLISNPGSFDVLARRIKVWRRLRPGKYKIPKGMSLYQLARTLRKGKQSPVNLVITKIRTKEQLASLIGRRFESDSGSFMRFLSNPDTATRRGLDTNTILTAVFPNTYTYLWNSTPSVIFRKLYAEYTRIWTNERKELATRHGLTPQTAYILASIIEEETNLSDEKGNIASVYLNRLKRHMKLGADPTVKFALRDFELRRIYEKHLSVESPYNTYRYPGLPPGPICTPSLETLDAVLHAPETDYLYFVAKSDFSKRHVFTKTYAEHLKYARAYQKALNELLLKKQQSAKEDVGNKP